MLSLAEIWFCVIICNKTASKTPELQSLITFPINKTYFYKSIVIQAPLTSFIQSFQLLLSLLLFMNQQKSMLKNLCSYFKNLQ